VLSALQKKHGLFPCCRKKGCWFITKVAELEGSLAPLQRKEKGRVTSMICKERGGGEGVPGEWERGMLASRGEGILESLNLVNTEILGPSVKVRGGKKRTCTCWGGEKTVAGER